MYSETRRHKEKPASHPLLARYIVASAIACCTSAAWANDLLTAYRDALAYDAQYVAAKAVRDAGLEKVPQARAGLLPTLTANANTMNNRQDSLMRLPGAEPVRARYNSNGWTVQLSQPLFRWQNWVAYTQAELGAVSTELELQNARQELMLRVSQAYFEMLLAEEAVATANAQIAAIQEQLAVAKKSFEVGAATITDTHEAQARFDLTSAQKLAAESELLVKRETLRTLTGRQSGAVRRLRQHTGMGAPQPADATQWAERAFANNLQVLLRQRSVEIAEQEIEKQRAAHLPTVDLVATHGTAAIGNSIAYGTLRPGTDMDTTTVGIQLSMPLFAGGATNSRTQEAVALKDKALAELDQARRKAELEARQSYLGVSSGLAQIRAYEAAMTSSQSSVDSNKLAFKYGVRINIDVLNAQSQLYETRQKLVKARIETLLAQLKLKSAVGDLSEDDLMAINGMLE